jgi:sulfotransferase family protein
LSEGRETVPTSPQPPPSPAWSTDPVDVTGGPVVVGGVGGSGTRVVAEILQGLGVYLGADLNDASDNRWFTLLCKLPRWDPAAELEPGDPALRSLRVLERAMTGRLGPTRSERCVVADALERATDWWRRSPLPDDRPPDWLKARARSLLRSGRHHAGDAQMWGWKEPNSHVFIGHLHRHFGERLRYVQVIRNGVDMAHSRNQLQVRRWGPLFGVTLGSSDPTPTESLDYWIRANEAAIHKGLDLPSGQFLVVNYDELCADPRPGTERLADFLGLDPSGRLIEELAALPRRSLPRGETGDEAVRQFGTERLARVRALGFPAVGHA